jgi:hypothetical protein
LPARCHADARRDEHDGVVVVRQDEFASGSGDIEDRPLLQLGVQVGADGALASDADPVRVGAGARGQRIAALRRRIAGSGHPQRDVLPGCRSGQAVTVLGGQVHRDHGRALGDKPGDAQVSEARPAWLDADRRRSSSRRTAFGGVEQFAEGLLPARAERGDVDGSAQLLDVSPGQVQQGVDVGDAERVPADPGPHDLVARPDMPFGDHAQVEARAMVGDQQGGELGFIESHANPEAGDAWLGDLELGLPDAVTVADTDVVVAKSSTLKFSPNWPNSKPSRPK